MCRETEILGFGPVLMILGDSGGGLFGWDILLSLKAGCRKLLESSGNMV
jgi:hypothetical protein